MIKVFFTGAQPVGRSREELRRHISEVHGQLVVNAPQVIAPMYRYVQHHSIYDKQDTAFGVPVNPGCDLVVEMLHESVEAMVASRNTKDFHEIVGDPDEKNLGDPKGLMMCWVKEVEIVPGAQWPIVLYHFLKRRADLTREEFQDLWQKELTRLVPQDSPKAGLRRYVQNHVFPTGSIPFGVANEGIDIIDEYRFETLEGMAAFGMDRSRYEKIANIRSNLVDSTRSFSVITQAITFIERK